MSALAILTRLRRPFTAEEAYHVRRVHRYGDAIMLVVTVSLAWIALSEPVEEPEHPIGPGATEQRTVPPAPAIGSGLGMDNLRQHPAEQHEDREQERELHRNGKTVPGERFLEGESSQKRGDGNSKNEPVGHPAILTAARAESIRACRGAA